MGRWAQASRRGSVGPADAQQSLTPPTGDIWELFFSGTTAKAGASDTDNGATAILVYWRIGTDLGPVPTDWPNNILVPYDSSEDLESLLPGQTLTARAAFATSTGARLSALSDPQDETL